MAPTGAVTVVDVASANGTRVGTAVATEPVELAPGSMLEVGTDRLQWVPLPRTRLSTSRSPDGRLDFDRVFAPAPAVERTEVALPAREPSAGRGVAKVLLAGLVPAATAGILALVTGRAEMLLFALMGPLTGLSSHVLDRRQWSTTASRSPSRRARRASRTCPRCSRTS